MENFFAQSELQVFVFTITEISRYMKANRNACPSWRILPLEYVKLLKQAVQLCTADLTLEIQSCTLIMLYLDMKHSRRASYKVQSSSVADKSGHDILKIKYGNESF